MPRVEGVTGVYVYVYVCVCVYVYVYACVIVSYQLPPSIPPQAPEQSSPGKQSNFVDSSLLCRLKRQRQGREFNTN